MQTLTRLFNFVLAMTSLPLVVAFVEEAGRAFVQYGDYYIQNPFLWGFLLCLVPSLILVFVSKPNSFTEDLLHELAHVLSAYLFLKIIRSLRVKVEGQSYTEIVRPNFLISLAPYYLPILTVPLLIARPFVRAPANLYVDFAIGATLALHYVLLIHQASIIQKDFVHAGGVWFSFCVSAFLCAIILAVALATVRGDYRALPMYFVRSWERTLVYYGKAIGILQRIFPL
jgi:hypothetical protein